MKYVNLFVYRIVTGVLDLADPFNLYYDSPEQCENHLGIKIDNSIRIPGEKIWKLLLSKTLKMKLKKQPSDSLLL